MRVHIDNQQYNYVSDYSPANKNWKIQAGAAFRYPVRIGTKDCFVKRFTSPPPGLGLLFTLKGSQTNCLPTIYDVVEVSEHHQSVTYLFMELIDGDILDEIITRRQAFHSRKLTTGLLECLQIIHNNGYWFSDFCEKNIFFDKNIQRYTLIDLDSCEPIQHLPSPIPNTPGYIPGQEFAAAVVNFYKDILKQPNFSFSSLSGTQLNTLQLIPLVAKLELFVKAVNTQPNFIYKASNFPKLQEYIASKQPVYSRAVFNKVHQKQHTAEMIATLCGFFASSYGAAFEPKIISFKVKPTQAEAGDTVTFSWETLNANQVEIKSSDGSFLLQNLNESGSYKHTVTKGQRFRLIADDVSQTVDIRLLTPPKIKAFSAARTQIYIGEKVALNWEIEGRPKKISLSEYNQNGQSVWSDTSFTTKGTKAVTPKNASQTYILDIGSVRKEILITATPKPKIDFLQASPLVVLRSQGSELSWKVENVSKIHLYKKSSIKNSKEFLGVADSTESGYPISLYETTTYTIEAGDVHKDVTITVLQPRILFFNFSKNKITLGESFTLSWDLENTVNGQLIEVHPFGNEQIILSDLHNSGSLTVKPNHNISYKLSVGSESRHLSIKVIKPGIVIPWLKRHWIAGIIGILNILMIAKIMHDFDPFETEITTINTDSTKTVVGSKKLPVLPIDSTKGTDNIPAPTPIPPVQDTPQNFISEPVPETNTIVPKNTHQSESFPKQDEVVQSPPSEPEPSSNNTSQINATPILHEEHDAGEGMKWRKEGNFWALYDESGARVADTKYTRRGPFKNGKADVYDGPNRLTIDKKGNKIN